jgi:hypothetical protein
MNEIIGPVSDIGVIKLIMDRGIDLSHLQLSV